MSTRRPAPAPAPTAGHAPAPDSAPAPAPAAVPGPGPVTGPVPVPAPASASAYDLHQRLAADLRVAREALARWQGYADAYERERNDAHRERAHLLAWLAALHRSSAVLAPATDAPGEDRHLLHLMAGGRWLTWRIARRDLPLFPHVPYAASAGPRGRVAGTGVGAGAGAEREAEATYAHIRRHTGLLALDCGVPDGS